MWDRGHYFCHVSSVSTASSSAVAVTSVYPWIYNGISYKQENEAFRLSCSVTTAWLTFWEKVTQVHGYGYQSIMVLLLNEPWSITLGKQHRPTLQFWVLTLIMNGHTYLTWDVHALRFHHISSNNNNNNTIADSKSHVIEEQWQANSTWGSGFILGLKEGIFCLIAPVLH